MAPAVKFWNVARIEKKLNNASTNKLAFQHVAQAECGQNHCTIIIVVQILGRTKSLKAT
jgi:hypothetical protein